MVPHTAEPALTLFGDPGMAAGRSLARAGSVFGSSADELIIGTADGAWVVDVAAMLSPTGAPVSIALSMADGVELASPNGGPLAGLVVGALWQGTDVAVWVGDGKQLHLFYNPPSSGAPSPSLTLTWDDPVASTEMITAVASVSWEGAPALAVGCSQCAPLPGGGPVLPGVVRVFLAADVFGGVDLFPDVTDPAAQGQTANSRFGQSLAAFSDGRLAIGSAGSLGGQVWVTNPDSLTSMSLLAGSNSARLGWATAIGDPNANGTQDLIVGGPEALFGTSRFGMIRTGYEVPPAGTLPSTPLTPVPSPWYMQGPGGAGSLGPRFGQAVAVGDINGDYLDDILVGAPRAMDGAGNNLRTGVVYVILGGLENNSSAGGEIRQYLDPDGDGFGSGPQITRCALVGVLPNGDCDEGDPNRSPGHIEQCGNDLNDDCISENDGLLCEERFATIDVQPATDLTGSKWCAADVSWQIGPTVADVVSIADLVELLDDEELFFDDPLDHGIVGSTGSVEDCKNYQGPSVILDVINPLDPDLDEQLANSRYDRLISDVVVDVLSNNPQGYLIGSWDPDKQRMVVLGGSYPGLVNGVVELLRATEDTPTTRAPWHNNTVLDWPEVPVRRLVSNEYLIGCTGLGMSDAAAQHVDWRHWLDCGADDPNDANDPVNPGLAALATLGRESMDLALRYHFSAVRGGGLATEAVRDPDASTVRHSTYFREQILYLRRRGIDFDPALSVVPMIGTAHPEPLGVEEMGFLAVPTTAGDFAFPCDSEDCAGILDDLSYPGYVVSSKYAMPVDGPDAGVIYAKNMLAEPFVADIPGPPREGGETHGPACGPDEASARCLDGPCFCFDEYSSTDAQGFFGDVMMSTSSAATLYLGAQEADPDWQNPYFHDDDWYTTWSPTAFGPTDAFRPGRLYALHYRAHLEGAPLGFDSLGAPNRLALVTRMPMSHVFESTVKLEDGPIVDGVPTQPTVSVVFVFRAPLQSTELPPEDQAEETDAGNIAPAWFRDPMIQIEANGNHPDTYVVLSDLAVVELDGLSAGWWYEDLDADGDDDPAISDDFGGETVTVEEVSPATFATGDNCAGVDGCLPYTTSTFCPHNGTTPLLSELSTLVHLERMVRGGEPFDPVVMTASHLTRFRVSGPNASPVISGVQHPGVGMVGRDPCTGARPSENEALISPQPQELLAPAQWGHAGFAVPQQLKFLEEDRIELDGHSVRDYLFGPGSTAAYRWHTDTPVIFTNILTEIRGWNIGFAGWRDGVFRPIPNHEVARGLFCNLANVVADPDWTDINIPYRSYAGFAGPAEDPITTEHLAALSGETPCTLTSTAKSGYQVVIDANMHMDSTTWNFRGDQQVIGGSLSMGYMHADQDRFNISRPSGATLANTMAENVDSQVWNYYSDPHDLFENLCDVTDASELLFDHTSPGAVLSATEGSRNTCMMTPLPPSRQNLDPAPPPPGVVYVKGAVRLGGHVASDSVRNIATIAAAHPELIAGIEASDWGYGDGSSGALHASLAEPLWGHAARCMWNPGWATFAAVSLATAHANPADGGRWCPSGSVWAPHYLSVGDDYFGFHCDDQGKTDLDVADCVYADRVLDGSGSWVVPSLQIAISPDLDSTVELPASVGPGMIVRVSAPVGASVGDPVSTPEDPTAWGTSCGFAEAFSRGTSAVPRLLGKALARVYFLDAAGQLLDESGGGTGASCSSPLVLSEATDSARVEPRLGRESGRRPVAWISAEAVVPQNAVQVGVIWHLPPLDPPGYRTGQIIGTTLFAAKTGGVDPSLAPAIAPNAASSFPTGGEPFADDPQLPNGCLDSDWYHLSADDVSFLRLAKTPGSIQDLALEEEEMCLLRAVGE